MSELLKAADDARRLLAGFAGLQTVADALEKAGRLEQAQAEADKTLLQLRADIDQAKKELADATAESARIKKDAKTVADTLTAEAKTKADTLIEATNQRVASIMSDVDLQVANAKSHLAEAESQAVIAQEKRDALLLEAKDLESRIAKARAQAAKLLGD